MDIRKAEFRMTLKFPSKEERYFMISHEEMEAILISSGKPTSILLKDQTGEEWWVSLAKAYIDIDMQNKILVVSINHQ